MTGHGRPRRGAAYVYDALVDAGVELVVGIPGTQTLPLDRTIAQRDDMRYVMARHETAVPHIAWGYYETGGGVAATLTVPGPGDTNAIHGLKNALEDNVPILHVSPDSHPDERGKGPIHELDPATFDHVVKENVTIEREAELPAAVARGIECALTPPFGPVRLGVPSRMLDSEITAPGASVSPETVTYDATNAIREAVTALQAADRPLLYVGGGARRSPGAQRVVRDLAATLDAPVLTTLKGKGVFPEDDPRWLGVSGSHFPASGRRVLDAADVVLALGTDFDGVSTADWSLPMGDTLVHVNLVPRDIGVAYDVDVPVVADVTDAGNAILEELDPDALDTWDAAEVAGDARADYCAHLDSLDLYAGDAPARTPELLSAVRDATPRDAPVALDVGGFRLWAMQTFETYAPDDFVCAGSWAGMGVGLPAGIGAALANPDDPVVVLTGDGGLMMCIHELHTAAEYDLDVIVVVSNNEDYAIISKSPKIDEYTDGHRFTWDSPDFAAVAEGFGVTGTRVETAAAAGNAVADAIATGGPHLIDVTIDPQEPSSIEAAHYEATNKP